MYGCCSVQVNDDDYYDGPLQSDYESDDSNGTCIFSHDNVADLINLFICS